jgi:prepilin peptidase CpaA
MMWGPVDILLALLAVALAAVIVGDWRARTISNWLNGAIALLAIPFWWIAGLPLWPDVAVQLGMALVLFVLFALAFRFGAMGGGDVKLIAALALWLPPLAMIKLLLVMSLAGGLLTVVMLIRHRLAKAGHKLEIPYGIAIAFGGFWVLGERYLNQFG